MARRASESQRGVEEIYVRLLFSFASSFFVLWIIFGKPARALLSQEEIHKQIRPLTPHHLLHDLDQLAQAEGLRQEVELLPFREVLPEGVLGVAGHEDHLQVGI